MYTEDPKLAQAIDDALNAAYDTMTDIQDRMSYLDAIRWVSQVRDKLDQTMTRAVIMAYYDGRQTKTDIAQALGTSRQTVDNRWGKAIASGRAAKTTGGQPKVTGYRYRDGKLTAQTEPVTPADLTAPQRKYRRDMIDAIMTHTDSRQAIIDKALTDGVIPAGIILQDRDAIAFISGDTDTYEGKTWDADNRNDAIAVAKLHLGLTAGYEINPADLQQWRNGEAIQIHVTLNDTTPEPAKHGLPKPVTPAWEAYKRSTSNPTYEDFGRRYGVSRTTVSRRLKAEAAQNAQK